MENKIPNYLQDFKKNCSKVPKEVSPLCKCIENLVNEFEKKLGPSPPVFGKEIWDRRKGEVLFLRELIEDAKTNLDDTQLIRGCEVISSQKLPFLGGSKLLALRLREILFDNNFRCQIDMNKNGAPEQILRMRNQIGQLLEEKEISEKEIKMLKDANRRQASVIVEKNKLIEEMENLKILIAQMEQKLDEEEEEIEKFKKQETTFGKVLVDTITKKEMDMRENFIKELKSELEKQEENLAIKFEEELAIKQGQIDECLGQLDELKVKNAEWGSEQFRLRALIDSLEKQNRILREQILNSHSSNEKLRSQEKRKSATLRTDPRNEPTAPSFEDLEKKVRMLKENDK